MPNFLSNFARIIRLNICHRKLHHILHCKKEICHLELTLGASSPEEPTLLVCDFFSVSFRERSSSRLPYTYLNRSQIARFGALSVPSIIGDSKGTTKKLCDKDFAERSGEFSGVICLKTLVLLDNDRLPPRIVQKIFWCCSREFLVLWVFFGPLLISEAIWGLLTSQLVRRFCQKMLYFFKRNAKT